MFKRIILIVICLTFILFSRGVGDPGWVTTWSTTLNSNTGPSAQDYSFRPEFPAAALSQSGTKIRITIEAITAPENDLNLDGCSIGEQADAGDDWDYKVIAGTPTRITWDTGNPTTTVAFGNTKVSDEVDFILDSNKNYLIHFFYNDEVACRRNTAGQTTTNHYKAGEQADETMTVNIAGRTTAANEINGGINKLEVYQAPAEGNAVFIGANFFGLCLLILVARRRI